MSRRLVLRPFTVMLKIFGFYIGDPQQGVNCRMPTSTKVTCSIMLIFQLACIATGTWFFADNCKQIIDCRKMFGLMHRMTISLIILGLKPLHATVNLGVFLIHGAAHRQALQTFVEIDDRFRHMIRYRLINRSMIGHLILAMTLFFVAPMAIRVASIIVMSQQGFLSYASVILVPMLSVWQLLPLYYFYICMSVLSAWLNTIYARFTKILQTMNNANNNVCGGNEHALVEGEEKLRGDLADLMELYHKTVKGVFQIGSFFGPFIFFSMGISLAVLCVTIYYLTNTTETFGVTTERIGSGNLFLTYVFMTWTGLQVVAAFVYLVIFCVCGWQINELCRRISPLVLGVIPTSLDMKFRLDQTINKVFTQFNWGISVWRIMLIERSLLLTMTSGVVTYTMVLLKLQPTECNCANVTSHNTTT